MITYICKQICLVVKYNGILTGSFQTNYENEQYFLFIPLINTNLLVVMFRSGK